MRESAYNLCVKNAGGDAFLFNARLGTGRRIESRAYRSYWAAVDGTAPLGDATELLAQFIEDGFLVENDADELRQIETAHLAARTNRDKLSLVLAPAMACNLDCVYCFEANRYPGRMSEATQTNLVRLVRRYFETGTRRLAVTWYGGEPLLAFFVIRRLSEQILSLCREFDCAYAADIVTNGTLLTPERAKQLASWKVARAQITLDGVPEIHDRQRASAHGGATFGQVLDGIKAAAEHMHVSVRVNVCRENAARLEDLLRILADRGLNAKVSLYLAPIRAMPILNPQGPAQDKPAAPQRAGDVRAMSGPEAADLLLAFDDLLRRYRFPAHPSPLPKPRNTACMADQDHSWLIEANGDVQKCDWTAGLKDEAVGRLTPNDIAFAKPGRKWRDWSVFRDENCASCIMLPLCLGLCPLRGMSRQDDNCPPFKHTWPRVLTGAADFAAGEAAPARLPLAGSRIRDLRVRDLAQLVAAASPD